MAREPRITEASDVRVTEAADARVTEASTSDSAHPVGEITKQGPHGVPMQRYAAFIAKESGGGGGPHPVSRLTRQGPHALPMRLTTFTAKAPADAPTTRRRSIAPLTRARRQRGRCAWLLPLLVPILTMRRAA